jgi:hypothetical protein
MLGLSACASPGPDSPSTSSATSQTLLKLGDDTLAAGHPATAATI